MFLLRPLTFNDLQGLERLAVISGGSMTTLPNNRDHLSHLINTTRQSLRKAVSQPAQESYHFVLEEMDTGEIVGVSGVEAAVGLETPFYSYRIDEVVHASSELQIHNRIPALHLCQDYTGAARLCTLFLDKAHRQNNNLQLLSRARMLFMAAHPERFAPRVMVELQGIADDNNQSPFWECLGRHFFNMDFNKANYLTGINSKGFIAGLMPQYPVYVPLLSKEAQAALGKPRQDMQAVSDLLEAEGFVYRKYVDIFDAGPSLEARTDNVRTVSQSQLISVQVAESETEHAPLALISNEGLENYRCLIAPLNAQQPTISPALAEALALGDNQTVRVIWL